MFLRSTNRLKDGKDLYYWSLVENRCCNCRAVQRDVLLFFTSVRSTTAKEQWIRAIEVFDEVQGRADQLKLFAVDRPLPDGVQVRLKNLGSIGRGSGAIAGCSLSLLRELGLDRFWRERLGDSSEGTDRGHILQTLCCYRLVDPRSEWRLHGIWFVNRPLPTFFVKASSLRPKIPFIAVTIGSLSWPGQREGVSKERATRRYQL